MAAFTALFTVIAVVGAIATESTFSLLHLAERYVSASCEAQRAALLAAVEAVVAADLWSASASGGVCDRDRHGTRLPGVVPDDGVGLRAAGAG